MTWQPGWTLAQVEKDVIFQALKFFQGNKVQTARALDISERTLYNKLEQYEVEKNANNGAKAQSGVHVEPSSEVPSQQPVPMREQEEIQEMPLRHASGSSHGKRGKRV